MRGWTGVRSICTTLAFWSYEAKTYSAELVASRITQKVLVRDVSALMTPATIIPSAIPSRPKPPPIAPPPVRVVEPVTCRAWTCSYGTCSVTPPADLMVIPSLAKSIRQPEPIGRRVPPAASRVNPRMIPLSGSPSPGCPGGQSPRVYSSPTHDQAVTVITFEQLPLQ